jgi:hypothetical protein
MDIAYSYENAQRTFFHDRHLAWNSGRAVIRSHGRRNGIRPTPGQRPVDQRDSRLIGQWRWWTTA